MCRILAVGPPCAVACEDCRARPVTMSALAELVTSPATVPDMTAEYVDGGPTLAELEALEDYAVAGDTTCDTYWGSHGCDRRAGHPLPHVCGRPDDDGVCSIHDGHGCRFVVYADHAGDEITIVADVRPAARTIVSRARYPMSLIDV
jgi:hypothetical protein